MPKKPGQLARQEAAITQLDRLYTHSVTNKCLQEKRKVLTRHSIFYWCINCARCKLGTVVCARFATGMHLRYIRKVENNELLRFSSVSCPHIHELSNKVRQQGFRVEHFDGLIYYASQGCRSCRLPFHCSPRSSLPSSLLVSGIISENSDYIGIICSQGCPVIKDCKCVECNVKNLHWMVVWVRGTTKALHRSDNV
jgi:hypothetical protein